MRRYFVGAIALTMVVQALAMNGLAQEVESTIGLDGYCPVCVIAAGKWEKGSAEITSTYDGVTYLFPNQEIKQKFEMSPAKFVPALGGDCIVCLVSANKRVAGSVNFSTLLDGRLFLFPNAETKAAFEENPAQYQDLDLAADGNCVVCRNQTIKGSTDFTEVYQGMRYLFPSADAAAEFRRAPQQYAATGQSVATAPTKQAVTVGTAAEEAQTVSVSGRSTCAVCEFGVKPLGNPEELGMAIKTNEGHVVVVEQAHALYPEIYKARYAGQNVQVEGRILKSEGRVSWLDPSSIRIIN